MPNIILDTNALRLFQEEDLIDRIASRRDLVFIHRCAWEKERKGVFGYINIFYESTKKLGSNFHEKSRVNAVLPNYIANQMKILGASKCDFETACLALDRQQRTGEEVHLISDDPHIHNLKLLFHRVNINAKDMEEFRSIY
ncbi:MAG: hypothetical protein OEY88_09930 [Candidatus Bathyarchaeota archaeon]|nr:hypothetical protein [Candidatus Bathyarchaeota archaeon]